MPDEKRRRSDLKRAESTLLEQVQTLTPEQQEHVEKVRWHLRGTLLRVPARKPVPAGRAAAAAAARTAAC